MIVAIVFFFLQTSIQKMVRELIPWELTLFFYRRRDGLTLKSWNITLFELEL